VEFLTKLNTCLAYLNSERKQYYILGDININTLGDNYQENYCEELKEKLEHMTQLPEVYSKQFHGRI